MDKYQNLKGKLFKRNKYGLSEWTQKVERVSVVHNMNSNEPYEVWIYGNGQNIFLDYISEIQFVD